MRLSEAIRLGAMLRPQAFYLGFFHERDGTVSSCALGAAYEAFTGNTTKFNWAEQIRAAFPVLSEVEQFPCECGCLTSGSNVGSIIIHLNDLHYWTRQRIADWVETIEPQEQPQSANAVEQQSSETALKSAYI